MSLNFLPGRPNDTRQTICQGYWQNHTIFTYCSGNNLIILSNKFTRLQTIYLEQDCIAVDINPENGFIAVAVGNILQIYKPIHQVMKNPKWAQCCQIYHDPSRINCIRWGKDNEVAVGSDYLSFWKVKDVFGEYKPVLLWNKKQAKPVYVVAVADNSQLIASFGKYDHTVKLWKRISISGEQVIFTLSLLPHPETVTAIRWKKTSSKLTDNKSYAMYTLCSDKKLRIWLCFEADAAHLTVQCWGTIPLSDNQKYCLILDNWIINELYERSKKLKKDTTKEYAFTNSDIIMLGEDNHDIFDIYELDNISSNPPRPMVKKQLLSRRITHPAFVAAPTFFYFAELQPFDDSASTVSLIIHDIQGVIRQSLVDVPKFLDQDLSITKLGDMVLHLEHKFTGHNKSIQKLARSSDGEALLTLSRYCENCVWTPQKLGPGAGVTLTLKSIIETDVPVKLSIVHEKGNLVICLLENNKLQAWECPSNLADSDTKFLLKSSIDVKDTAAPKGSTRTPVLMLNTPESKHNHERHFLAIIYSDGYIQGFEVSEKTGITEISSDPLNFLQDGENKLHRISTIDPVHSTFFSDRALISLITENGFVETYKAIVDYKTKQITWKIASKLNTGIKKAAFIRGSSTGKICIVSSDCKSMTLWDLDRGVLEYEEAFENKIEDIDWTSTEMGQSIVAIGFTAYSLLYTQLRYDYTNSMPSYLPIEKIDITSHTAHTIGDSIWMKNGTFVVASGNQLYTKDKSLDLKDPFTSRSIGSRKILSNDILHLNSVLNGPLPIYHPQFLIQAIYANKVELVKEILLRLFLELRKIDFESKDVTTDLRSDLNIEDYKFLIDRSKDYPKEKFPDPYPVFDKTVKISLTEQLTRITLPYVTRHQQITLITVVEAMDEVVKNQHIMDHNGIRFLLGVKLFLSHRQRQKGLLMRDVAWALHSESKTLLLSLFDSNITSWANAKEYKIAYWLKEKQLVDKIEQIAKFEFSKEEKRDPSRCAIFYLALKKKQILLSLWKISAGHPEQQKMMKFLSNDFTQPRWRTAALKNAFVLLSKHRYMDAACFFLVGNSLKDAVNVLCKQVNDMDLAIAVCRLYEGDDGDVLGNLLRTQLLPKAILESDKWTTSYIYWKLRKQEISIKALVTPPVELENNKELIAKEMLVNNSFLVEDPALLYLYKHLRTKNINYFLGSLDLGLKIEYALILKSVDILCRMGCDYLASSLVTNWKFVKKPKEIAGKTKNSLLSHSTINKLIEEPTSTARVRPSLFDKFDNPEHNDTSISSFKENPSSTPVNLLDTFATPPTPISSVNSSKNILDEFKQQSKPKNMLEDFGGSGFSTAPTTSTPPVSQSNILDDFTKPISPPVTERKPSKKIATAPRSLLDDFM